MKIKEKAVMIKSVIMVVVDISNSEVKKTTLRGSGRVLGTPNLGPS